MAQPNEDDARTGDPDAALPLTPAVFHIMLSLADGERHGYSIMREVERYTDGALRLGPTTLYRSIRQMLASGFIEEADARPDPALDDERRRYYRLTKYGRQVALAETRRLERLVARARATSFGGEIRGARITSPGLEGLGGLS
ncbi:MAG TPA: PadR family transcriptional regulator [Ktedonobacterales bacterium]